MVRWLALLLPALVASAAEASEPKRVLIIHTFGRDFAPFNATGLALRTDLATQLRQPVVFRDVSLDAERGDAAGNERPLVEYLVLSSKRPTSGSGRRHRHVRRCASTFATATLFSRVGRCW